MLRFIITCVFLAAVCVASVVLMGQAAWKPPGPGEKPRPGGRVERPDDRKGDVDPAPMPERDLERPAPQELDQPVRYREVPPVVGPAAALIIQDARVLPTQRQDVPSERDGKLLFLATPAKPGEVVPADKLIEYEFSILAVEVPSWTGIPEEDRIRDVANPQKFYRHVRPSDDLAPGMTTVVRQRIRFRKLDIGDRVEEGQLLGIINPAIALEDLIIKQVKVEGAEADVRSTSAMKEESKRRLDQIIGLRAVGGKRIVNDDDHGIAKASVERYINEEVAKRAAVKQAQRELSSALTTLRMHMVRASIPGVIKTIFRHPGEAVKNLEAVLQIQNPKKLRVEAQLEVQDAQTLRRRLEEAASKRREADRLSHEALARGNTSEPPAAQQLRKMADELVSVVVEVSRLEPPKAALAGHLQEVTCVAVSKGPLPRIVSGSEDFTVRIWERIPGEERWQERARLDHLAIVRSLACSGPGSARNWLLSGTATGRARLFDLDNLKSSERILSGRHAGAVNTVAFSANGKLCATGGEDRTICVYDTESGELLTRVSGAHSVGVTSLVFTAKNQLVSAGKDKRLVVWNLGEGGKSLTRGEVFDRRSGDVATLGVDPTGEHVLFDEGRELRVMSLSTRKIEGTLANPVGTASFATMALYSPDGQTILTNGNAPGRLQLWRTPSSKTRAAELRNYVWSSGNVNCGAFDPTGAFVVTGTSDGRVLVWEMPSKEEAQAALPGQLSYVEEFLDTSLKRVAVRAILENPGWVIPGGTATIVVPPRAAK